MTSDPIDQPQRDELREMTWDEFADRWPQRALEVDRSALSALDADNIIYHAEQLEEERPALATRSYTC